MKDKEYVIKRYPLAYCARGVFRYTVWRDAEGRKRLGSAWSAKQAWKDAARKAGKD